MKIFLDIGAHTGETLAIALEEKYHFDKIYCFEPISECCDILRKYEDKRVVVCEYGLWNENCTKQIYAPKSMGASLFKDKFNHSVESRDIKLVSANDWFTQNLKTTDQVYLKINCEGAECAILDNLITSGEYKKIDVLMVDFDVRKIPSQKHLMSAMKTKLKELGIPKVFYIDEYHLGKGSHRFFTDFWLNSSGSSLVDVGKVTKTLGYLANKYHLDLTAKSPIEIPNVGRDNLAQWLHELNFKVGVEVGVARGEYSEIICRTNPQMKIYGIDPWKTYKGHKDNVKKEIFENIHQEAEERLVKYSNYEFIKEFSLDALKKFKNKSLDFVYIDANHKDPYVTQDITEWSKKIKPGGIIAGHDYIRQKHDTCDVIRAVDLYTSENKIKPWFLLGLNAKIPGMIRDNSRSWMWIKT